MATYERITYRPEGERAQTVILENVRESNGLIVGIQVNSEGDEVCGKGFDERLHVIDVELVVRRVPLHMDNIYGELVECQ